MSKPQKILIVDDWEQEKLETVAYTCTDVEGEIVYITQEGLQYSRDALHRKRQYHLLDRLDELCKELANPDIVIWDPSSKKKDTLLYYRHVYFKKLALRQLICLVVKVRDIKFLYNIFVQQSGKVKGHNVYSATAYSIWYIHPRKRPKRFGIRGGR